MTRLFEAKPFIIAEVGSNWSERSHVRNSISLAKACGADAVKFQLYDIESLFGYYPMTFLETPEEDESGYVVATAPSRDGELDKEWLADMKDKADKEGIELICTAFSPELVEAVDHYVTVHKIASSDLNYPQLLRAVAKTGKPIILSTGASSKGDIEWALGILGEAKARTVLMYCVSAYPARTVDLRTIDLLRSAFGVPVGFSDHTTDIISTPVSAVHQHGAVCLEKHFTAFPELDSPDRPHSLTTDEFQKMVKYIRGDLQPAIAPSYEEKPMMLRHNCRLIAKQDIKAGDKLVWGKNYGAYRSSTDDVRGLSPFLWDHKQFGPEGKAAKHDIKQGQAIGPGDF